MPEIVDGSFDAPKGRKVFVRRREDTGESAEVFAERAVEMLRWAGHPFADDQDEAQSSDLTLS